VIRDFLQNQTVSFAAMCQLFIGLCENRFRSFLKVILLTN